VPVFEGDMDAGVMRSGLLEKLQSEGQIDLADLEVLDSKSQPGYPYLVTGRPYPEWAFLALPWVDKPLRENVILALLNTQAGTTVHLVHLVHLATRLGFGQEHRQPALHPAPQS
jgi:phosphonate ABC transporter substrate-binding protein